MPLITKTGITSHRFNTGIPEKTALDNSIEALRYVSTLPYVTECECDVQLTADGTSVLAHDEDLKKVSLLNDENGLIKDYTWEELERIPVQEIITLYTLQYYRSFFVRKGSKSRPTFKEKLKQGGFIDKFEEVLDIFPKDKRLLVEIKMSNSSKKDLEIVTGIVNNHPTKNVIFQGYDAEAVLALKDLSKRPSGLLMGFSFNSLKKLHSYRDLETVKESKFDFYSLGYHLLANPIGLKTAETIIKSDKGVRVWTVNIHGQHSSVLKLQDNLVERGCILNEGNFSIITDVPFLYYEHRQNKQEKQANKVYLKNNL